MSDETKTLESHLEEEDWAIIIGNDNKLKGLFIPDGKDEEEVPESILYILEKYFGIDLADTNDPTFH